MKRVFIISAVAVLGIAAAVIAVMADRQPTTRDSSPGQVPMVPYDSYIAGAGVVEATTGNIAVGTPVAGIVMEIYVEPGDEVKRGDPLFKIDDRALEAEMLTARAGVRKAEAALQKPQHRLEAKQDLRGRDPGAISLQDVRDLRDEVALAEASLAAARAQVQRLQKEIDYHTVRAPVDGEILQRKMRPGEYVEAGGAASPLMLLGGSKRMNLRVDIDEYDAWRFQRNAAAMAFVRGHPEISVQLRYEYTEPFVIPKTDLQGGATERTDTRVLQVLYSFDPEKFPVYIGQQLDVYIEAPPVSDRADG